MAKGGRDTPRSKTSWRIERIKLYESTLFELRYSSLKWQIAQHFRQQRLLQGLTQKKLARKTNLSQPDISRLETLQTNPTIDTLQRIAKALNCTILFRLEQVAPPTEPNRQLRRVAASFWYAVLGDPVVKELLQDEEFLVYVAKLRQREKNQVEMSGNEPESEKSIKHHLRV